MSNPTLSTKLASFITGQMTGFLNQVSEKHGIDAVHDHEKKMNHIPINPGPLQSFFEKVHTAKKAINLVKPGTLKTAIITARSRSVGKRVRQTIEGWNLSESVDRIDFMSGACKTSAIERFCTDILTNFSIGFICSK